MTAEEQRQRRRNRLRLAFQILFTLFTVGTVLFIFSNSMEIGEISGERSGSVTAWLNGLLEGMGFGFRFTDHQVRKLAHFSEYAMLGFWLMLTLRVYTKRIITHIFFPLFMGLAIPVADESLQLFVSGRTGQVRDILIDFSGVLGGIFCGMFLLLFVRMVGILRKNHAQL